MAKMDFRLVPEQRPYDIAEKLRKHLDKHGFEDVEVEVLGAVNPYRTDLDSPWVQMVAETAEEIYGRKAVMSPNMAGTGPMFDFGDTLGMPIATSGVDHPSHKIHAPNENITIEDFLLGARHAALIIDRFARVIGGKVEANSGAGDIAGKRGCRSLGMTDFRSNPQPELAFIYGRPSANARPRSR